MTTHEMLMGGHPDKNPVGAGRIRGVPRGARSSRLRGTFGVSVAMSMLVSGCQDLNATLPAGTPSPAVFDTPVGAITKRNAADSLFERATLQFVLDAGLLSDELEDPATGASLYTPSRMTGSLDERILPQFFNSLDDERRGGTSYVDLQAVRGSTNEAIGALATYDSTASPALRGEMYAVQGYAEVMLAELFCSGVPLSTYDFHGDFTYRPGSTQRQVYQDALVKFDSAIALSADSVRILNLARVGRGRALLDLSDYAGAAAAVVSVPDGFRYQLTTQWSFPSSNALNSVATVADREGTNGLPFVASGDPRTRDTASVVTLDGRQLYFPHKYASGLYSTASYYSPITVADGVEARLIQAEAALAVHDTVTWLATLNALRTTSTTCTVQTTPNCASSAPAGTGGVAGLPLLVDPGSSAGDTARVNLLFGERASWLYVTGHRQGDLRRLIRQYHRDQSAVYPTGQYLAPGQGVYGTDVTAPIPSAETPNPYFNGCIDRNA